MAVFRSFKPFLHDILGYFWGPKRCQKVNQLQQVDNQIKKSVDALLWIVLTLVFQVRFSSRRRDVIPL